MKNKNILYISITMLIYLIIISFPTYVFTNDLYVIQGVELGIRSAFLVFVILFSIFTKIAKSYTGKTRFSNLFLLLPLFFVAFTNLFYLGVVSNSSFTNPFDTIFNNDGNNTLEILRFLTIIVTVLEEEILFRYIIQRNLTIGHKIFRILTTAAIFAGCHFFTMLYDGRGVIAPIELIEVALFFGVGIILGFLYEYTNNIFVPITFNLIYSISNKMLFKVSLSDIPTKYFITVSIIAASAALYLVIFYFFMLKREKR